MKAIELFEEVNFEVGTRTRLTLKVIDENATLDDAFEYANEMHPSNENEEWDSFQSDIDENNEIILHR